MYLKYIQIVNYKNLKSSRFVFDKGANTIIGENDAGKSNAMTAIRILLDDAFYYNSKRLKESDFSDKVGDWKGHWIIISAYFDEISTDEKANEICKEMIPDDENQDFLKSFIRCQGYDYGVVSLFIRPQKSIRRALFCAQDKNTFNEIRNNIRLSDYEFYYTSRSQMDFTNEENYKSIVGDLEEGIYADPDNEDTQALGCRVDILEVWKYISVVFIDALRDVEAEMHKPKNPIRRIIDEIQSQILDTDIDDIKNKIQELNSTISKVEQVAGIGNQVNGKLNEMIGMVYSPDIRLESQIKDDMSTLSKYITMLPADMQDIELLGLGHLNMLYVALKLVEFEVNRNQELVNIMIIEEPEAHIHTHIQKTLFENLSASRQYTQVLMTTHSTHLSEVADITKINVLKSYKNTSLVMQPSNGLDDFGKERLEIKGLTLTKCLERYLDAKRSVLLFSKGIILVEGDGEEIFIPNLIKMTLGVSLDELGIGLINVGSVAFENISCIFAPTRLQRYCSIITDFDQELIGASKSNSEAAKRGVTRREKLMSLFEDNPFVESFYAPYTLEVDFANIDQNRGFIKKVIEDYYIDKKTIENHKNEIDGNEIERYDAVLTVAKAIGKGWYASMLSNNINASAMIPEYILDAVAFACRDVINISIKLKMIYYALCNIDNISEEWIFNYKALKTHEDKIVFINDFCEQFSQDIVSIFIRKVEKYGV